MKRSIKVVKEGGEQTLLPDFEVDLRPALRAVPFAPRTVILNKTRLCEILEQLSGKGDLAFLKKEILNLREITKSPKHDQVGLLNIGPDGDTISLRRDAFALEGIR